MRGLFYSTAAYGSSTILVGIVYYLSQSSFVTFVLGCFILGTSFRVFGHFEKKYRVPLSDRNSWKLLVRACRRDAPLPDHLSQAKGDGELGVSSFYMTVRADRDGIWLQISDLSRKCAVLPWKAVASIKARKSDVSFRVSIKLAGEEFEGLRLVVPWSISCNDAVPSIERLID